MNYYLNSILEMKTPKEWINTYNENLGVNYSLSDLIKDVQIEAKKETETESYNQGVKDALKLAAEKAKTYYEYYGDPNLSPTVDKESILNLEKELLK